MHFLFFGFMILGACTPSVEVSDSVVEPAPEPVVFVEYVLPYPADFDFENTTDEGEILAAFEKGYENGGDPLWLMANDLGAFEAHFGGHLILDSTLAPEVYLEDAQGRPELEIHMDSDAGFGENVITFKRSSYPEEGTWVEYWGVLKQSDQLAYPRLVYFYYQGLEEEMGENLVF